ncbi:uncharacterized protein PRCAT00002931001 [Priceomyces carsonii]|uniref:uncharacterized protein n=1 Tax=Priceomyces carsonii TaxID=28549 RepID=UPI002ED89AB9|nr:unnamed protein product [Priceomyces carsonii]
MRLPKFFSREEDNKEEQVKEKGFEVADCDFACESCESKFPKSMKVDMEIPIWNSTQPYDLHFVISSGKTDWIRDPSDEKGQLPHEFSNWITKYSEALNLSNVKLSVSSLHPPEMETDEEYSQLKKGDVLLLPFFVWIKNLKVTDVSEVLNRVVPDLIEARNSQSAPTLSYDQFPSLKFEIDNFLSYILLCSHRTRDKRCGITAPIMKKEIDINLRDFGLLRDIGDNRPDGVRVVFINHVGGHKFVANVIIYLKKSGKNIWLARCTPNNVKPIIEECILKDGKVWPDNVRLIQRFEPIDW